MNMFPAQDLSIPDPVFKWVAEQATLLGFTDVHVSCVPKMVTLQLFFEVRCMLGVHPRMFRLPITYEDTDHLNDRTWPAFQRKILDRLLCKMAAYSIAYANCASLEKGDE